MSDKSTELTLPFWLLPALSWAVSLYCGIDLIHNIGFLPDDSTLPKHALLLLLFLLFLFLPFFTKIKIGKLLEVEREVHKTKEDVQDFKNEVRSTLSVISTNVNTISGISNSLTFNLPNTNEIREARREVEINSEQNLIANYKQDELEQLLQREDPALALAWVRIEMERLLRQILGKRLEASPDELKEIKFAAISRLFSDFTSLYPRFRYLDEAFRSVVRVCNAAIHGQSVSYEQAQEAAGLGGQIIAILKKVAEDPA